MGWFTAVGLDVGLDGVLSGRAERKRQRLRGKLINVCPHVIIDVTDVGEDDELRMHVQPLFETFVGTTMYRCQGCGLEQSEFAIGLIMKDWENQFNADPVTLIKNYDRKLAERNEIVEKLNQYGGA